MHFRDSPESSLLIHCSSALRAKTIWKGVDRRAAVHSGSNA